MALLYLIFMGFVILTLLWVGLLIIIWVLSVSFAIAYYIVLPVIAILLILIMIGSFF